ncbi:MAG: sulfite exporter TauE/SafE family protein, partial [Emticicia sp.]
MKRIALALSENVQMKFIAYAMIFMKVSLLGILIYRISTGLNDFHFSFDSNLLYYIGVGFLA